MTRPIDAVSDWFLGGPGKRQLLYALAHPESWGAETPPWSKKAIARLAGLQEKKAVERHIVALVCADVIVGGDDGYEVNTSSPLLPPLRDLTDELAKLAPERLPRARGG